MQSQQLTFRLLLIVCGLSVLSANRCQCSFGDDEAADSSSQAAGSPNALGKLAVENCDEYIDDNWKDMPGDIYPNGATCNHPDFGCIQTGLIASQEDPTTPNILVAHDGKKIVAQLKIKEDFGIGMVSHCEERDIVITNSGSCWVSESKYALTKEGLHFVANHVDADKCSKDQPTE